MNVKYTLFFVTLPRMYSANISFEGKMDKKSAILLFLLTLLAGAGGLLRAQTPLTNLPTIYIQTENNAPIHSKETYVKATVTVASDNPGDIITNRTAGIRGRGNSTWNMSKKPYRIKFDEKINFLQQKANLKNWVLLANHADKTLMRNALAFKISKCVGLEFTPAVRFADVVLNGEFVGNYMVTDQIEINKGRVPAEEQSPTATTEPEISGGYLLEIDGFASSEPLWFQTERGVPITIKYPKDDEINDAQRLYIINYIRDFENLLFSDHFSDPETGYRSMIDTVSVVNWYIACELTGNSDSFWSTYIYKKRGNNRLFFGPLWDYDIAFNNDNRQGDATEKLMRQHGYNPKQWIQRIWSDSWFRQKVNQRWTELIDAGLEDELTTYITDTAELLEESQQENFRRWNVLNKRVHLEYYLFNTYSEGVDYLKEYIKSRVAFLTGEFKKSGEQKPFDPDGYYYRIRNENTNNLLDIQRQSLSAGADVVMWEEVDRRHSQQWRFRPAGNGIYRVINRSSGLALTGNGMNTTLTQEYLDTSDKRQQWTIELITDNTFGLLNQATGYAMDNRGGSTSNGTAAIEWNNQIYSNKNQSWYLEAADLTSLSTPGFRSTDLEGYIRDNVLILEGDRDRELYRLEIYSLYGQLLMKEAVRTGGNDVSTLPAGIYLVRVYTGKGVVGLKVRR